MIKPAFFPLVIVKNSFVVSTSLFDFFFNQKNKSRKIPVNVIIKIETRTCSFFSVECGEIMNSGGLGRFVFTPHKVLIGPHKYSMRECKDSPFSGSSHQRASKWC